ncbi:MAG TPA: EAL domain-containing protein [Gemmatimonadales bacterium]|nr:EAL domain-containing protein [Gemmatimonadales bacterium]
MVEQSLSNLGFRPLLEAALDATVVVDSPGRIVALNHEGERLFGWTEQELVGQPMNRLIPTRFHRILDTPPVFDHEQAETQPKGWRVSLFARRRNGSEFPVEIHRGPLGSGSDPLVLVTIRDLTEWRRAQESLFREKEQALITLESIGDAVITTDTAGRMLYLNPMAERLTGWRTTEALGLPSASILTLVSDLTREPIESTVARCLQAGRAVDLSDGVLLLRRDGTEVAIGDSAAPIRDRNGITTGVVLVFHDVTEKRRVSRKLSHEAAHDALTSLVNRKEFERRLTRALGDTAITGTGEHALFYLDLDQFKPVNDFCGHEAGDELLRQISVILSNHLRKRDTLARLGGDEFAVLLENCSLDEAEKVAETVRRAVEEFHFLWAGRSFSLGISIGVVSITPSSGRMASVLRAADAACYSAKEEGGNRVFVDRPPGIAGAASHHATRRINRLAQALDEGRFHLYAQSIMPLLPESGGRTRYEILLRLPDERGNLQPAASFLPQAERYNLMPAIDRWVIRRTIELLGGWHRNHPECELPLCSINLSAQSLDDDSLVPRLREQLSQHRLPAQALCFEIAEASALANFAHTVRFISEIRTTGCGVALDDFGNGVLSFSYLKALAVDFLKIGGHYVRGVVDDPVYGTIVTAVNQVGRLMGIATIAEEVDSEPVLHRLRTMGIGYAQGRAVAVPEPLADAEGEMIFPCFQQQM